MRIERPALVLSFILFLGCGDEGIMPPSDVDLIGTVWRLESFDLASGRIPAPEDQELTLQLLDERVDGQFRAVARADCNGCDGTYTIGLLNSVELAVGCTEMWCGTESRGEQFSGALNGSISYLQDGEELRISYSNEDESGVLEFRAQRPGLEDDEDGASTDPYS